MSTTTKDDLMSPDASPGEISKKAGVRRVNNWPMIILLGAGLAFVIMMAIIASDRAAKQNQPGKPAVEKGSNTSIFAQALTDGHVDGMVPESMPPQIPADPVASTEPTPTNPGLTVVRPDDMDTPPTPPSNQNRNDVNSQDDQTAQSIRAAKLQMFQQAVQAKSTVPVTMPRSPGSSTPNNGPVSREEALARITAARQAIQAQQSTNPTAAYKERLAQLRGINGGTGSTSGASDSDSPFLVKTGNTTGNGSAQFDKQQDGDRWELKSTVEAPRTPFELRAGFVVPATMISGINSDLPGTIMAQVSQDVFDTATGRHKLIPQGTRLVGAYSNDVAYGQSRVLVAWQRLVFPDGKAMDIGSMPGADGAGYSGFTDQTNNHLVRLFGSAFLMSGITAGVALSQPAGSNNGSDQTASGAMSEALGQQLGTATAQMISKNLNVAPTLEIRPGYRFNVIVTKDMTFSKPYKSFDY
nr:TrbI/VirB10 family protein [Escherichia coli]